jgi:gliding motility-associated lipoprotein GldH
MKKHLPLLLLILVGFSSCESDKIYEKHIDNERITWNRFDVKTFQFDITDISSTYDFYIVIRHHTEVPLKSITVQFVLYTPSGKERIMEHEIMIRDQEGKPLGDGMGDLWDLQYPAWQGFRFTAPGTCKVEISSAMPQVDLPGILQVGLIVRKV